MSEEPRPAREKAKYENALAWLGGVSERVDTLTTGRSSSEYLKGAARWSSNVSSRERGQPAEIPRQHVNKPRKTFERPRMAGERLMTAPELADYLGLPRRSIYYWANKGSIPHVRVGRSLRFVPEQVRRELGID